MSCENLNLTIQKNTLVQFVYQNGVFIFVEKGEQGDRGPSGQLGFNNITGDTILTPDDNYKAYTINGAGALVQVTLPDAVAGFYTSYFVTSSHGVKLIAPSGNFITVGDVVSASGGSTQSNNIGSIIDVYGTDDANYYCKSWGVWDTN